MKSLRQRIYNAVKSGRLIRIVGTPAERMTDFELAQFLVKNTPEQILESYLTDAYNGTRVEVSGTPPVSQEDSVELLEKLTALAKEMGGRVRLIGEGLDGSQAEVTIYDGRSDRTSTNDDRE